MQTLQRNGVHVPKNRLPLAPLSTVSDGDNAPPPIPPPACKRTESKASGRDAEGRFAAGNKFAVGNPFARRMATLRSAMLEAVTENDLKACVRKMVELAKSGDVAACKLLMEYVVGRPAAAVDPDRLDLDELAMLREAPSFAELSDVRGCARPEMALVLVKAVLEQTLRELDTKLAGADSRPTLPDD